MFTRPPPISRASNSRSLSHCVGITCFDLLSLPELSARGLELQIRLASNQSSSAEPTLDALLHAVIPAKYVDQVSADAILSLTNTTRRRADPAGLRAEHSSNSLFSIQLRSRKSSCRSTRSP